MDHHDQGSGVELELGDSTSLKWEEEFVLAAQRLDFIVFDSDDHGHDHDHDHDHDYHAYCMFHQVI